MPLARRSWSFRSLGLTTLAAFVPVLSALGQDVQVLPLITLSSEADERIRLGQVIGATTSAGFLIRSAGRLTPFANTDWTIGLVAPEVNVVRNSALPFSLNDGSMWAGRGWNASIMAGGFAQVGSVRLIVAPTFVSEQNLPFQVIPYPQNATSPPGLDLSAERMGKSISPAAGIDRPSASLR